MELMENKRNRQFFFRADGNGRIGAGHLMRCLTIAEGLAFVLGGKEDISFLTADEQSAGLIESRNFRTVVLGGDCARMEEELPFLDEIFRKEEDRLFLVDSYFATDRYLTALKKYGRVWLLDDMQKHAYPADVVVNYNLYASSQRYRKLYGETQTHFYLGTQYAPIRLQFLKGGYELRSRVKDVLITTGGGDSENIAAQVLEAVWRDGINYHVVVGRFHPHVQEWRERGKSNPQIHVHVDVSDMAGLMRNCDIAITAGGSTVYELAAVGIPFLCFSYAENQEMLAESLGKEKIAVYAGKYHREPELVLERLKAGFGDMAESFAERKALSTAERQLIDGRGAFRIAALMSGQDLS